MWDHPITDIQLSTMKKFGAIIINPIEKLLACGEYGMGAMETVDNIVKKVNNSIL